MDKRITRLKTIDKVLIRCILIDAWNALSEHRYIQDFPVIFPVKEIGNFQDEPRLIYTRNNFLCYTSPVLLAEFFGDTLEFYFLYAL